MVGTLTLLVGYVLAGELLLLGAATAVFVDASRLADLRRHAPSRLRESAPYLAVLVAVLVVNKLVREIIPEVSWLIGWNVTPFIHGLEGAFVADLQSVANPVLTTYFSFVYIFGYVFVLTFPFVAYLALSDRRPMKVAAVAYAFNYGVGLVFYLLFVSYGPRNLIPDLVDPLLYATYPRSQILTSAVNTNTNVFPSLHTSLSVTTAGLALRTRDRYPAWAAVAIVVAASISVATMYLGIHWATDVVAGSMLGACSVVAADRIVDRATSR